MIGLFQTSSLAQLIVVIGTELILTVSTYIKWPHSDSHVNLFHVILGCIKVFILGLNITYLPQLKTSALLKLYMGYVQMALHSLVFFLFFALIIKNIVGVMFAALQDHKINIREADKPRSRELLSFWRRNDKKKNFRRSRHSAELLIRQSQQSTTQT
ncbi:hypothetical protein BDF20DRAFT_799722, partial [Mycotypha africana]|uniref:uncharacterized protein n=1 Tax=Mycotypha africana TaxID=64632 RepID=UPI0023004534